MEYYDNNLAVTQQMKLDMIQQMQQQKLIQRLLMIRYWFLWKSLFDNRLYRTEIILSRRSI